ncbi:MAG: tyrosine-type recombinase/integrase [Gallionella sp.]
MARALKDAAIGTRETRLNPKKIAIGKYYWRSIHAGLHLGYRRPKQGSGTWSVRLLNTDDTYTLERLGTADDHSDANGHDVLDFSQAQKKALKIEERHHASGGVSSGTLTVKTAIDAYILGKKAEGESQARDAEQRLNLHVIPKLGKRNISELTLTELRKWRDQLVSRSDKPVSKSTANRIMNNFKAALNRAFADESNGLLTDKAWRVLESFEDADKAREDHFMESEVLTLIEKANEKDPYFANLLEAAFYTGARYGELCLLDVRHFDAKRGQVQIPGGKTGARITTLTAEAVAFFKRLAAGKRPRDILLPRSDGTRWGKSGQHRPMKAALQAAGLPASASFYTLRHTYISRAIELGMPLTLVAENVGTSVRMIESNYGKFIALTRRDLVERTAPVLRVVVKPISNAGAV